MTRSSWKTLFNAGLVLMVAALACNFPGMTVEPTIDPHVLDTRVAQTIQAQQASASPTFTLTPTLTFTPETPTQPTQGDIPTAGVTLLPTVGITPQPGAPTITASVDTNCRLGPGRIYQVVGYLLVGQQSTVHGRESTGQWWYIANLNRPSSFCWVWAQTTTVVGDTSQLPILTPPPTPTSQPFPLVTFHNFHVCGFDNTAILRVVNTWDERLRSMRLTIIELATSFNLFGPAVVNFPFMFSPSDCPPGDDFLEPGNTGFIGGEVGPLVTGAHLRAVVLLCTERDLDGECAEVRVDFVVP